VCRHCTITPVNINNGNNNNIDNCHLFSLLETDWLPVYGRFGDERIANGMFHRWDVSPIHSHTHTYMDVNYCIHLLVNPRNVFTVLCSHAVNSAFCPCSNLLQCIGCVCITCIFLSSVGRVVTVQCVCLYYLYIVG
jgi:hypothetical protein